MIQNADSRFCLQQIPNVDYDKNRLEQELIYYIEKLDVNEEKQRLGNHLKYFINTLETGTGQGKKLGFIAQEMGREINTLGSKSNHAEMQKIVVQMKEYHPVLYANFLTSGTLHRHLAEIDQACNERMEIIVSAMTKQEGATEALKAADQMEWVRRMNSIRNRAEEIILTELVYD